jgi:hypothetical protein
MAEGTFMSWLRFRMCEEVLAECHASRVDFELKVGLLPMRLIALIRDCMTRLISIVSRISGYARAGLQFNIWISKCQSEFGSLPVQPHAQSNGAVSATDLVHIVADIWHMLLWSSGGQRQRGQDRRRAG